MKTRRPPAEDRPTDDQPPWKRRLYCIIFESKTPGGKAFDVGLLIAIGLSVTVVMLESVKSIQAEHAVLLRDLEWIFTGLFTIEYIARLLCVRRAWQYAWSFYGVIDLLAILPSYINLFTSANYVMVVRVLRLLRVFRVLKLAHFLEETDTLVTALRASRRKIMVFIFTVLAVVIVMGTLMYLIEGEANGFTSIPYGIYWAIVTLTTVGYGDITSAYSARPIYGQPHHDHGLWHHRGADGHLFHGTAARRPSAGRSRLRELRDCGIRSRRAFCRRCGKPFA